ncbi:hypothetical protein F2Q68_00013625 [Brassica cretica]|uniref:Myb-like domain-containing protein n=1 Tax=Brassica cretica TaxID=69181 RepID=A0A8S9HGK2_BRACR|nr:hypothetical protein F2Q68_00013625 [Brassica cretica]
MGRKTWFDDDGMKKGEWTAEEDQKLVAYINEHGLCDWRSLPERAAIAKEMENRTDNDIKNHWNSCLKKRLSKNGIDPMTHEPIINNLTVTTTNEEECGSSPTNTSLTTEGHFSSSPSGLACLTSLTTEGHFSSSPSGLARLLNKLAAGIASRQHDLDRIKNILLDRKITINDQDEEGLRRDQKIGEEDDFLIWDDGEVRRYMDIDPMEYETTPYDSVLYESTQILDHLF